MDADAAAGNTGEHTNSADCTFNSKAWSACAAFDTLYNVNATGVMNTLRQKTALNYTTDGSNTNSPDVSSVSEALDGNGNGTATAAQLDAP